MSRGETTVPTSVTRTENCVEVQTKRTD